MYHIVVWYNHNKDSYYYRKYYSAYKYEIGYKNGYGHEVVLIIDLTSHEKISLKKRVISRLIRFLKNIE